MKKNLFKLSFVLFFVLVFLDASQAKADAATTTLDIRVSNYSPFDGATTTISVWQFDQVLDWIAASNATVNFGWGATTTDINGQADIMATSSMPFSVSAAKTNFLSSSPLNIIPQVAHANITIRNGATVAFSASVALPASNSAPVDISPTASSSVIAVPARSLLSLLKTVDTAQNEFAITDLQYYYFAPPSFYINCLTITAETNPLCGSWQYNLNGVDPSVGVNHSLLKNGDIVFLYFGNQRQVSLSTTAVTTGTAFTATTQKYDPTNNGYVATTGFIIGITQPDPNNPWSPIEIATSTADANGQAVFTINTAGIYNVGIKEDENIYDSYFPFTTLTVTAPVSSSGGSVIIIPSASASAVASPKVNLGKAIDFLIAKQSADGSFGSALQTDWAALALASANPNGAAGQKIKNYLLTDPNPLVGMNPVSDYSRRAMALMSLNISPYEGTKTNYVKKIISLFDGRQFGDVSLYNDDIFALLVLNQAGYGAADKMMQDTVNFILAKQLPDGSWLSVDLTAAAVQALTPFSSLTGVSQALPKARNFLYSAQLADGGFGNTYATAWVMQAIAALGEDGSGWLKNNNTSESYLALNQGADGGLEKDNAYEANRVWSTAYAIPAVQGKPWFNIMKNFSKQDTPALAEVSISGDNIVKNKIATSTLEKLDLATTSPEVLITASSTESSLQVKIDEKKAKPETVETASVFTKPAKQLTPRVLAAKITSPKAEIILNNRVEKKPNQEITRQETASTVVNNVIPAPAKDNGDMATPTAKEKTKATAKKVLYVAGAGTILAGIFLLLKLLGFLL